MGDKLLYAHSTDRFPFFFLYVLFFCPACYVYTLFNASINTRFICAFKNKKMCSRYNAMRRPFYEIQHLLPFSRNWCPSQITHRIRFVGHHHRYTSCSSHPFLALFYYVQCVYGGNKPMYSFYVYICSCILYMLRVCIAHIHNITGFINHKTRTVRGQDHLTHTHRIYVERVVAIHHALYTCKYMSVCGFVWACYIRSILCSKFRCFFAK